MARIRAIKPEFWSSPDVDGMDPWVRLLYIAMWNWADDNGRGTANPREIGGFAFPYEDFSLADIRRMLDGVRRGFGVAFYKVDGRLYYAIPTWDRHQKIDKRSGGRHPAPEDGEECDPDPSPGADQHKPRLVEAPTPYSEEPAETPPSPRWDSGTGTGEQGNRGTEKAVVASLGMSPTPARTHARQRLTAEQLAATAQRPEAFTLVAEWRSTHQQPYQRGTYDAIAQHVDAILAKGADPDVIREALTLWDNRRDAKPGLLPHLYDDALHNRRANGGQREFVVNGLPTVPVDQIPDEYLTRDRIDEVIGPDSTSAATAPRDVEFGPYEERKAWYDAARDARLAERRSEARKVLIRRQEKAGAA